MSGPEMLELGGGLVEYGAASDARTCMPPYCSAAISWGERGRDLRLSFCRRFWNHIYTCRQQKVSQGTWAIWERVLW